MYKQIRFHGFPKPLSFFLTVKSSTVVLLLIIYIFSKYLKYFDKNKNNGNYFYYNFRCLIIKFSMNYDEVFCTIVLVGAEYKQFRYIDVKIAFERLLNRM